MQLVNIKTTLLEMYKQIARKTTEEKAKVITEANEKRTHPPDIQPRSTGYRKQTEKQSKTKPPFYPDYIPGTNNEFTVTTLNDTYHKQNFQT